MWKRDENQAVLSVCLSVCLSRLCGLSVSTYVPHYILYVWCIQDQGSQKPPRRDLHALVEKKVGRRNTGATGWFSSVME
ncbi:hypothetical protein BO83DRAFT_374055 [Aspergillus eucalypticola CBS 122712]|uniref:Uncharacterized protein n=1 Tax=Aspergillus eucalypticola (strain CBS 122712 / IBT 29274) TaxID=1448314 RepID=A0A317WJR1_ASPEC|nr:uncharacterized protein BO83DRAFT_374055 [Aspergillus eucalypticola CBS 122712]PWY85308.1 hypothetical protein BO83DRAFT_374055 [Aspergillus eucalypticola CBS 122712]